VSQTKAQLLNGKSATVEFSAGTASLPAVTFTGDTNTGIYSPGADQVAVATNGTGRLFIDSSGRLGVGNSSPGAKLDVSGDVIFNGGGVQFPIQFANAFTPNAQRADLFFSANATSNNALRVGTIASSGGVTLQGTRQSDSSQKVNLVLNPDGGAVGIGTTSPFALLHVKADTKKNLIVQDGGVDTIEVSNYNTGDGYREVAFGGSVIKFQTGTAGSGSSSERMRIDNAGNCTLGNASNTTGRRLNIEATSGGIGQLGLRDSASAAGQYWTIGPNSSNHLVVYNQAQAGVYILNGGNSWSGTSDERLKTDLKPIENAIAKVGTLRAVTGRFIYDSEDVSRSFLIAQDVKAVLPEAVSVQGDEQGTLGLAYTDVIPLLVAALKESKERIETLEARLTAAGI